MKQNHAVLTTMAFTFVLGLAGAPVFAEEEIHWDSNESTQTSQPLVTPVESPMASSSRVSAAEDATPLIQSQAKPADGMALFTPTPAAETDSDLQESESSTTTQPVITPSPTMAADLAQASPVVTVTIASAVTPEATVAIINVQGVLKMKDVYALGMKYYAKDDYLEAIKYLKQSLTVHDPYTAPFYYAEANAMLGVIYQFHIIHPDLAYQYYHEALKIDPTTDTAKKHINEVKPDQK